MWNSAHDAYLEESIRSAGPVELVCLLYQAATAAVRDARQRLSAGDITGRSKAISKASAIVLELACALDRERGGDISLRLAGLYSYILRRLNYANRCRSDEPLAEVLGLLTTLSEGWEKIKPVERPAAGATDPWVRAQVEEAAIGYARPGWSL